MFPRSLKQKPRNISKILRESQNMLEFVSLAWCVIYINTHKHESEISSRRRFRTVRFEFLAKIAIKFNSGLEQRKYQKVVWIFIDTSKTNQNKKLFSLYIQAKTARRSSWHFKSCVFLLGNWKCIQKQSAYQVNESEDNSSNTHIHTATTRLHDARVVFWIIWSLSRPHIDVFEEEKPLKPFLNHFLKMAFTLLSAKSKSETIQSKRLTGIMTSHFEKWSAKHAGSPASFYPVPLGVCRQRCVRESPTLYKTKFSKFCDPLPDQKCSIILDFSLLWAILLNGTPL